MLTIDEDYKLTLTQHDNAVLDFSLSNGTLKTGDIVYFVVKKDLSQEYYDIEVIVDTFTDGVAKIFIPETQTNIDAGYYRYAICVHTSEGKISTVISNKLKIIGSVHK